MRKEDHNNIVIVTYQFSVVLKGIENNLKGLGYHITVIGANIDEMKEYIGKTALFIVYLPGDIMDDPAKLKKLIDISEVISKNMQKAIMIGEKKHHSEFMQSVPLMKKSVWLDRPIDINVLVRNMEKVIAASAEKTEEKRILIVEDDLSYAKMVREWLKEIYQISIVTTGLQAITFFMKNKADLILLDYEMSDIDGPHMLEMLKSEPDAAGIPVVFMTGIGTRDGIARVMSLKPSGCILKSTTRDNMVKYLRELFDKM